jgi:hypothetical protein
MNFKYSRRLVCESHRCLKLRIQEQILEPAKDEGLYQLSFFKSTHPKAEFYRRKLLSETYLYCNELIAVLREEQQPEIRAYYREKILDRHLTTCLKRLGERLGSSKMELKRLSEPAENDTPESLANIYVMHLLKVCVAKAYIEVQKALSDTVTVFFTETMLYANYIEELPPIRNFLTINPDITKSEMLTEPYSKKAEPIVEKADVAPNYDKNSYMLVGEVASILKKDKRTIRRRLEAGKIIGKKDESTWLVDRKAFYASLKTNNKETRNDTI